MKLNESMNAHGFLIIWKMPTKEGLYERRIHCIFAARNQMRFNQRNDAGRVEENQLP
jgi:hypothetical protein